MQPTDFCYWLQGFVELNGEQPTPEQWKSIKEHLQTVFKKITPIVSTPNTGGYEITHESAPTPYPFHFPNTEVTCSAKGETYC